MKTRTGFLPVIILAAAIVFTACSNDTTNKTLVSIFVSEQPAKTRYSLGEEFNPEGMVVIAVYSDASRARITAYELSGFESATMGPKEVTVSYGGKTAVFTVDVIGLMEIEITSPPDNARCAVGEDLDLTGLEVTAIYSDDSRETVPAEMISISGFDNTEAGELVITVMYGGKTAEFAAEVIGVAGIEISKWPAITRYAVGDELDVTGLEITVTFTDGTSETVRVSEGHITGFDSMAAEEQTLTVTYSSKTAHFTVEVIELSGIVVTRPPDKTIYYNNEPLDLAGLVITAWYSDGGEKIVTQAISLTGFDGSQAGEQEITVTYRDIYGEDAASFIVTVINYTSATGNTFQDRLAWLNANAASGEVYLLEVTEDLQLAPQTLSWGGMADIIIILRGTGGERTISRLGASGAIFTVGSGVTLVYDGGLILQGGGVYVNAGGKFIMDGETVSGPANVTALVKIEITQQPLQRVYPYGWEDPLNIAGLKVTAVYIGSSSEVPVTTGHISGFDPDLPGEQTLTVTWGGKTASFGVTVLAGVFTAYFDPNGGLLDGAPGVKAVEVMVELMGTVLKPDDPVKDGYAFGGWYASDNTEWNFVNALAHDIVLTAKWLTYNDADFGPGANVPGANIIDVATAVEWTSALSVIAAGGNNRNYVINVTADIANLGGTTANSFGSAARGIRVSVRGADRKVSLNNNGRALTVGANQTVILRDLELSGRGSANSNNTALVWVESAGTLEMRGSAGIIDNYNQATATSGVNGSAYGGGVYVNGGTLIMRDSARISGNAARILSNQNLNYFGGGVYVTGGGTIKMFGGTIGGETGSSANVVLTYSTGSNNCGAGVYIDAGSAFEMGGGMIIGNGAVNTTGTINGRGGGVFVVSGGTFRITDGIIAGNLVGRINTSTFAITATVSGRGSQLNGSAQCGYFTGGIWNIVNGTLTIDGTTFTIEGNLATTDKIIVVRNGVRIPEDMIPDDLLPDV